MSAEADPTYHETRPAPQPDSSDSLPGIDPTDPHPPGTTLSGFQILRSLGKGGFARVYLAWQANLQRTVAVKIGADRGTEPQTLAQLDHPSIVRVFDLYRLERTDHCLLSMAFVPGGTLEDVLKQVHLQPRSQWNGQAFLAAVDRALKKHGVEPHHDSETRRQLRDMDWPQVVAWIGARIAEALDYAHRRGVLHRDIKPANILITADGVPQLADFNVGRSQLRDPAPKPIFGGSLPYMAPEQLEVLDLAFQERDLDGRCDTYSLGMMLWKMLTGERPFAREPDTGDICDKIVGLIAMRKAGVPSEALVELAKTSPQGFVDVLNRSMAGHRDHRFRSGSEMARQLEFCCHPETTALLTSTKQNRWSWFRRYPIATLIPVGLFPNLIAAILNIRYNQAAVINARPDAQETFQFLVTWINPIFFTLGLGAYAWAAWPVDWVSRQVWYQGTVDATALKITRQRCTKLGNVAAAAGVVCWCFAGIIWPLALDHLFGWLPLDAHIHFLASLTLCGLIAAVYPFFIVTWICLGVILPPLLQMHPPESAESEDLKKLERVLGPYLLISAAVPLVGIAALVFIDSQDRTTMKILVAIGLAGCLFAYALERRIRGLIRALLPMY